MTSFFARWWVPPNHQRAWDWFLRSRLHKKHPKPFNKTERGRQRRVERRLKLKQRSFIGVDLPRLYMPMMEANMAENEFSVYQFFPDGTNECVKRFVGGREAMETAKSYITRPAAMMGIITKVMVTDGGDHCNFEWEFGKGIVFPDTEVTRAWNEANVKKSG